MRPSYNPDQQGFDFGSGNLLQDVCSIFDMNDFPNIEPEDVAAKLRCRGTYAIEVYRKAMAIWEETLDKEIINELRQMPNHDSMSVAMIAIALGEPLEQVESDLKDAINSLAHGIDMLDFEVAA